MEVKTMPTSTLTDKRMIGKVQSGGIVFSKPLSLLEGTEVAVRIESTVTSRQATTSDADEDFADLPFFGMWQGRKDMSDSEVWVRKEREKWHRRALRQD